MPNHDPRNKSRRSQNRRKNRVRSRPATSVKALLGRDRHPVLASIAAQSGSQAHWRAWLTERLPPALDEHVSGVVERGGVLTVFTESAAWSARLRFALAEIGSEAGGVTRFAVKVMPR